MLYITVSDFPKFELDAQLVEREAEILADRLMQVMIAENQTALISSGKKVSGETLLSVKGRTIQNTREVQEREVTAGAGYKFIRDGRRKGAPMPVHSVSGVTKRGGGLYEPLQPMLRWFLILGIPKALWFPIMRKISTKGIRPVDIPNRALRSAVPAINRQTKFTAGIIARGIVKRIA